MAATTGRGIVCPSFKGAVDPSSMDRLGPSSIVVVEWRQPAAMVVASMQHYWWAQPLLDLEVLSSSWGGGLECLPLLPLRGTGPRKLHGGLLQ